jgi:hypothetical protein
MILHAIRNALGVEIAKIRIEGHSDNRGKEEQNRELSYRRAVAVENWLVKSGIAKKRFESLGYGTAPPGGTPRISVVRARRARGLTAICHVDLHDPRFHGPTRDRLVSSEVDEAVCEEIAAAYGAYLAERPALARELRARMASRVS